MKKFVCSVCGYVHEGETAPEKCPVCGSFLEEKGKKNPKIVCSNEKCGYMREPEPEKEENTEE